MIASILPWVAALVVGARMMERLDRGLVAISQGGGKVFLSWRLSASEIDSVSGFNVYRDGVKVNPAPVTKSTNFVDAGSAPGSVYQVRPLRKGVEEPSKTTTKALGQPYLEIPLQIPPAGKTPDGETYTYSANDASAGDLDGDGQYEIVVKWYPSNAQDNAFASYAGNTYLDAYKFDGTRLWRIDLGRNIRSGAHYTQFQVMDYDGDGRSELACKTADGTIDGTGNVIGDPAADWRAKNGYVPTRDRTGSRTLSDGSMVADLVGRILTGPEYLTVFDGASGKALATTDFVPARGELSGWGDLYGNRSERYLAASAYLDGELPSIVMGRGYYGRLGISAWDFRAGKLTRRWVFDTKGGNTKYQGQGNHNLSVADVDGDGKDEIVYGASAFDHDGTPLYTTGLGHGDAMHLGDLDPSHPGLEVWEVHESAPEAGKSSEMHDARTGAILWSAAGSGDVGRGLAADIDASSVGYEMWSSATSGIHSAKGAKLAGPKPSVNFRIYWDGDLQDELLDGTTISKWSANGTSTLLSASGCASNNGSKNNPMLTADLFGDWREEAIWRTADSKAMRIYTTTIETGHRLYTLMHDPVYRDAIAWQNTAYNQPPHLGFWLGAGVDAAPRPDIRIAGDDLSSLEKKPSRQPRGQIASLTWIGGSSLPAALPMANGNRLVVRNLTGQILTHGMVSQGRILLGKSLEPGLYLIDSESAADANRIHQ